jgi:hypothetical protein
MSEKKPNEGRSGGHGIFEIDAEAWSQMTQRERMEHAGLLRLAIIEAITDDGTEAEYDEDPVTE